MSAGARTEFDFVEDFWQALVTVDDRLVARSSRHATRRRTLRTLAFAALALAAAAAIALAARAVLFGSAAPHRLGRSGQVQLGALEPGSVKLLGLRVADPDGGPPWGVRVFATEKHRVCFQVGRVVSGRLVALGIAGAFGNDGLAHALPVEGEGCTAQRGSSTRLIAVSQVTSAAGLVGQRSCPSLSELRATRAAIPNARRYLSAALQKGDRIVIAEARRQLRAAVRRTGTRPGCSSPDRRAILVGTTPPSTTSALLNNPQTTDTIATPQGVFLFVLRSPRLIQTGELIVKRRDGGRCALSQEALGPRPNPMRSPGVSSCDDG